MTITVHKTMINRLNSTRETRYIIIADSDGYRLKSDLPMGSNNEAQADTAALADLAEQALALG